MTFTISSDGYQPKADLALPNRSLQTEENWPGVAASQAEIIAVAEDCAKRMASVLGRPEDHVSVSITGHATPDHAPQDGWGYEFLSVTVNVRPVA